MCRTHSTTTRPIVNWLEYLGDNFRCIQKFKKCHYPKCDVSDGDAGPKRHLITYLIFISPCHWLRFASHVVVANKTNTNHPTNTIIIHSFQLVAILFPWIRSRLISFSPKNRLDADDGVSFSDARTRPILHTSHKLSAIVSLHQARQSTDCVPRPST